MTKETEETEEKELYSCDRAKILWEDPGRRLHTTRGSIREVDAHHYEISSLEGQGRDLPPMRLHKDHVRAIKPFLLIMVSVVLLGILGTLVVVPGSVLGNPGTAVWARYHAEAYGAEVCVYCPQDGVVVGSGQNITIVLGISAMPHNGSPPEILVYVGDTLQRTTEILDTPGWLYPIMIRAKPDLDGETVLEIRLRVGVEEWTLLSVFWEVDTDNIYLPPDQIYVWDDAQDEVREELGAGVVEEDGPPAVVRAVTSDLWRTTGTMVGVGILVVFVVWVGLRAKRTQGIRSPYFPDNPFTRFILISEISIYIFYVFAQVIPIYVRRRRAYVDWVASGGPLSGAEFLSPIASWEYDVLALKLMLGAMVLVGIYQVYVWAHRQGVISGLVCMVEQRVKPNKGLHLAIKTWLGMIVEDSQGRARWISSEEEDETLKRCMSRFVRSWRYEDEIIIHDRSIMEKGSNVLPGVSGIRHILNTAFRATIDDVEAMLVDQFRNRVPGDVYHDDNLQRVSLGMDLHQSEETSPLERKLEEVRSHPTKGAVGRFWRWVLGDSKPDHRTIDVIPSRAAISPSRAMIDVEYAASAAEVMENAERWVETTARGLGNEERSRISEAISHMLPSWTQKTSDHLEAARRRRYVRDTRGQVLRELAKPDAEDGELRDLASGGGA